MSVEYYQDKRLKWRWRVTSSNGEIVGASSQGFVTRIGCETNLALLRGSW